MPSNHHINKNLWKFEYFNSKKEGCFSFQISDEYLSSTEFQKLIVHFESSYELDRNLVQIQKENTPQDTVILYYKYIDSNIWRIAYTDDQKQYWYCNNNSQWNPIPPQPLVPPPPPPPPQ